MMLFPGDGQFMHGGDNDMLLFLVMRMRSMIFTIGVIICEGAEEDAAEFVHRLRQLRWKVCGCMDVQHD